MKKIITSIFALLILVATIQIVHAEIKWGETGTIWTISSDKYFCEIDNSGTSPQTYWWYNGIKTNAFNDCYRTTSVDPSSPNECCPSGYQCDITASGITKKCVEGASICENFTTSATCGNFNKTAGAATYEQEVIMGKPEGFCSGGYAIANSSGSDCYDQILRCFCYWNSADNKCHPTFATNNTCTEGEDWQCQSSNVITTDNCDVKGTIDSSWSAVYVNAAGETKSGDDNCKSDNNSVTCLSTAILSFVGVFTIIIVIILIIVFYLLKYRNKKKKKR